MSVNDDGDATKSSGDDRGDGLSIDAVSASLRHAYETTLAEEIPDSLMDLLRKLD